MFSSRGAVQCRKPMRSTKGFSLIELLIVIAVILVIAGLALPHLLQSRIAANESAAAQDIRIINSALITYTTAYPSVGYANSLITLGGDCTSAMPSSSSACLIDNVLASGTKSGYSFTLTGGSSTPNQNYTAIAAPQSNYTGVHYFCSFEDATIRFTTTAITTCDATIPAIQ